MIIDAMKAVKRIALLLLLGLLPFTVQAQGSTLAYCRAVADNLLASHTNEMYVGQDGRHHIKSYYQEWRYVNGVLGLAMLQLTDATGERKYEDFVKGNFDFYFDTANQQTLRREYDAGVRDNAWRRFFSMSSLDDCGAMGAALSELYRRYPLPQYKQYLKRIADYILNHQQRIAVDATRNERGIFCRGRKGERTLWLDDLYMSCSFLAHYGSMRGQQNVYITEAARQIELFDSLLYDPHDRLYWHCYYYDSHHEPGVAHWGRANGWAMMALTLVLDRLPRYDDMRSDLLSLYRRRVRDLCCRQDSAGMWHQLLDKPESYAETSCTAMFTYAIAKGVCEGWLDRSYAEVVERSWQALTRQLTPKGELLNVCIGTGISRALPFYYHRPTPLNDAHGLGPFILAGIQMNKLQTHIYKQ